MCVVVLVGGRKEVASLSPHCHLTVTPHLQRYNKWIAGEVVVDCGVKHMDGAIVRTSCHQWVVAVTGHLPYRLTSERGRANAQTKGKRRGIRPVHRGMRFIQVRQIMNEGSSRHKIRQPWHHEGQQVHHSTGCTVFMRRQPPASRLPAPPQTYSIVVP